MDDRNNVDEEKAVAKQAQHATGDKLSKSADRRSERLQELRQLAWEMPDPLQAGIRGAAADLLELSSVIGDVIKTELSAGVTNLRKVEERIPLINSLTIVHRQVTRYVQLDRDWVVEKEPRRGDNHRRQLPDDSSGEMTS